MKLSDSIQEQKSICKLRVKCFGNFEAFGPDGKPLTFPRTKCKEVLAYLVDRMGAGVTIRQIAAILWEDRDFDVNHQMQLQNIISGMMKTLRDADADDVIFKRRNNIAILPDMVDCDYYRFLDGDTSMLNRYTGEYMCQYSWGEFTNGEIWKRRTALHVKTVRLNMSGW